MRRHPRFESMYYAPGAGRPLPNPVKIARNVYELVSHGAIVAAYPEHGAVFLSDGGQPVRLSLWLETSDGSFVEQETMTSNYYDPQFAAAEWYEELRHYLARHAR